MNINAYLTIDDSPSVRMNDLSDYLASNNIQALFFCRGDRLEENMGCAVYAIQQGQVLANHSYDHTRASQLSIEQSIAQISRTEDLIDQAYQQAGVEKKGRYFRFPHIDRGMGGWIIDLDALPEEDRAMARRALNEGLNQPDTARPDQAALEKYHAIQDYLACEGYRVPFEDVSPRWYHSAEIQAARDCFFTFSTCDWMVTPRHLGKWPYRSPADLQQRIADEPAFQEEETTHIILAHDQADIVNVTIELIEYMRVNGTKFLTVE